MTPDEAFSLFALLQRACEAEVISHADHTALYLTGRRMYWATSFPAGA